ncbi:putative serine esterase-domain-containing protein [Naematelia encephala]|uniref:Putative serine esterase-domain-containing protein n=1 Tax=Naematelia encephala TaxID=71784 RepID=A0A1Y2AZG1_9TREE|nr:putative serine esterase-domain-containing protein [Naematelia encephala]
MPKVHLIILIHGLYGSPTNLDTVAEELRGISSSSSSAEGGTEFETVVYLTKEFGGSHTWDGIDVNAWRASSEVDDEVERLEDQGKEVVAFSVMGYSLGGLIARYLVGILHARQPSFFSRHKPISFSTAATPHLGVLKYGSTMNTVVHTVGRRLFSRTGRQLYALDREVGGRSLLDVLADPNHIFVQALQLFPRIKIVANGCNDLTVPYPTAAISLTDPFEAHASTGVKIRVSKDHIIESWVMPGTEEDEVEDLEDLRTPSHEAESPNLQPQIQTMIRTRPSVPPILFLPYPFPFRYALFLLLPIILPLWMLFVSIVFTLHTWQSRRRIWTHHSAHEAQPLLDDQEDGSASLRISHSRLIQLRSDHSTPTPTLSSSTTSTPPLTSPQLLPQKIQIHNHDHGHNNTQDNNHNGNNDTNNHDHNHNHHQHHPAQIPLLLTTRQKDMIRNLTTSLPQLQRLIAWFPWAYNAHGMIIVRDGKRFKAHQEGRGVVKAWTRWVVDSTREIGMSDDR